MGSNITDAALEEVDDSVNNCYTLFKYHLVNATQEYPVA